MQSLQHKVCQFPAPSVVAHRQRHTADVLIFHPPARQLPAWHPLLCILLFLMVTLGGWSAFFFLAGWLCGF